MTSTPSGARSPVEMSSCWTVAILPSSDVGQRLVVGRRLDVRAARDLDLAGLVLGRRREDVHVVDVGLELRGGRSSGGSPYSRGSLMRPCSSDTAAIAGEHRYTESFAVPERPGKLRLNVRSELASDGGAWPMPTHGPHTGSSIRTPPSTNCR